MTNTAIKLKRLNSGVVVLSLDLPGSKMNLLSETVLRELNEILDQLTPDPSVKGLIITSGKDDNFVAGANVNEIQALQNESAVKIYEASKMGKSIFQKLVDAPYRTVVAINGICLGGGTEMSVACQFRIATTNKKTKIGLPEVKLGFLPGWGGTVRLPHLVGVQQALLLITTGMEVDAKTAYKLGLIDEAVEQDKLLARAEEIALTGRVTRYSAMKRFRENFSKKYLANLSKPKNLLPVIVGDLLETPLRGVAAGPTIATVKAKSKGYLAPVEAAKVIIKSASLGMVPAAFEAESQAFARLATSDVSRNLVNIFFAQTESKRTPEGVKPSISVKKVGVLGAGVMGAGIAQAARFAGFEVVLKDVDASTINKDLAPTAFVDKGMATIKGLFDGLVEKGKMTRAEADAMMSGIKPTLNYADLADCDLVIEAVLEVLKVKQECLTELERVIAKPFVFASNTSSLSITAMAAGAKHPENVVGLHFFNPVHKMPELEVVRGAQTSLETLACAQIFGMKLGKTTTITEDRPGFVVNRDLTPYMLEGMRLAAAGVPIPDIDKAMKDFGMPMGPMSLLDEVGLDIASHVVNTMHGAFGERLAPPEMLAVVKEKKLLGKKGGKGIYLYDASGKPQGVNPDILGAIKAKPQPMMKQAIQDRLVLVMANEAVRILEEGIVTDPGQLDLSMIFGTGFPPFVGGPLRWIDSVGAATVVQKLEYLSKVAGDNYVPANLLKEKAAKREKFYSR